MKSILPPCLAIVALAACVSVNSGGGASPPSSAPTSGMPIVPDPAPPSDPILACDETINCPPIVGPGSECVDRGCWHHVCSIYSAFQGASCQGGHCNQGYCTP